MANENHFRKWTQTDWRKWFFNTGNGEKYEKKKHTYNLPSLFGTHGECNNENFSLKCLGEKQVDELCSMVFALKIFKWNCCCLTETCKYLKSSIWPCHGIHVTWVCQYAIPFHVNPFHAMEKPTENTFCAYFWDSIPIQMRNINNNNDRCFQWNGHTFYFYDSLSHLLKFRWKNLSCWKRIDLKDCANF